MSDVLAEPLGNSVSGVTAYTSESDWEESEDLPNEISMDDRIGYVHSLSVTNMLWCRYINRWVGSA